MFHKVVWQYMQGMLGFLIITLLQIYQGIFDTGNRLRYMIELWPWVCGLTFSAPCCVPTILQWVFCLCRCYRVRGVVMYQQAVAFHFQRTVRRWCAVSGKQLISSMQRDMLLLWTVTVLYSMTITHWPISDRPFLEAIASRNVFVLSTLNWLAELPFMRHSTQKGNIGDVLPSQTLSLRNDWYWQNKTMFGRVVPYNVWDAGLQPDTSSCLFTQRLYWPLKRRPTVTGVTTALRVWGQEQ